MKKSLFEKLNDSLFIEEFNKIKLTQEEWNKIHLNVEKKHKEILRNHKAIAMSYEKFIKLFECKKNW